MKNQHIVLVPDCKFSFFFPTVLFRAEHKVSIHFLTTVDMFGPIFYFLLRHFLTIACFFFFFFFFFAFLESAGVEE